MNDCIFCKIIERKVPATLIFENDDAIVIKDIAPKAPIHYLIIPKKHVRDIQSISSDNFGIGSLMFEVAQKLSQENPQASQFRFVINSGEKVGQRVFHLHAHFLAGGMFKTEL